MQANVFFTIFLALNRYFTITHMEFTRHCMLTSQSSKTLAVHQGPTFIISLFDISLFAAYNP